MEVLNFKMIFLNFELKILNFEMKVELKVIFTHFFKFELIQMRHTYTFLGKKWKPFSSPPLVRPSSLHRSPHVGVYALISFFKHNILSPHRPQPNHPPLRTRASSGDGDKQSLRTCGDGDGDGDGG